MRGYQGTIPLTQPSLKDTTLIKSSERCTAKVEDSPSSMADSFPTYQADSST